MDSEEKTGSKDGSALDMKKKFSLFRRRPRLSARCGTGQGQLETRQATQQEPTQVNCLQSVLEIRHLKRSLVFYYFVFISTFHF